MRRLVIAAGVLVPSISFAHISLTYPPPRTASQKNRVCGEANSVRGTNVTTLAPGATITVTWLETIDHPGHYRISFDADGQDFVIPPTSVPGATAGMPNVLIDPIDDVQGAVPRSYSQEITLPDIECNNCTLQLTQMMTERPYDPNTDTNIYYQCADITLSRNAPDGAPNSGPDAGAPDGGTGGNGADATGGCSTGGGAVGLPLGLVALGLVARRRRR
ncbi:MAG: SCE4755 family polysaccharide monooxygenase-like protein [Kofleriaceae bacterium]